MDVHLLTMSKYNRFFAWCASDITHIWFSLTKYDFAFKSAMVSSSNRLRFDLHISGCVGDYAHACCTHACCVHVIACFRVCMKLRVITCARRRSCARSILVIFFPPMDIFHRGWLLPLQDLSTADARARDTQPSLQTSFLTPELPRTFSSPAITFPRHTILFSYLLKPHLSRPKVRDLPIPPYIFTNSYNCLH